jgi:uncharacterized phage protein gp47/JayE
MSGSNTTTTSTANTTPITVAAPPTTEEVAADFLSWIGAQNAVLTDVNVGSQVRTFAEAIGSVVDVESVTAQALAFQALVYAAFAAFGVEPLGAVSSLVSLTFSTGTGANPPPVPVAVAIAAGTITQTVGGIQFQTLSSATFPVSGTSVVVPAAAVIAGANGNVPAGAITQILSSIPYTLQVTNTAAAIGGSDAETPAQTLARFTAIVGSIGLGTPVAIANACIGVSVSGTTETVKYATCYEPWIAQMEAGNPNPTAGFQVYVDDGSGQATAALLTAVQAKLDGNLETGDEGNRPAGVPYSVKAVVPVRANVTVSGTAIQPGDAPAITSAVVVALNQYFSTLQFGQAAQVDQVIAAVATAVQGNTNSLSVVLTDANGNAQQSIPAGPTQRIIPNIVSVTFT